MNATPESVIAFLIIIFALSIGYLCHMADHAPLWDDPAETAPDADPDPDGGLYDQMATAWCEGELMGEIYAALGEVEPRG